MTRDKWLSTVSDTESSFRVIEKSILTPPDEKLPWFGKGEITLTDADPLPCSCDTIIFESPQGKIKFTFEVHPRFIREKTLFAKRLGSTVTVEKIYDTSDPVHTFTVYQWRHGGWEALRQ